MIPAIFLDRDGTINKDNEYVAKSDNFSFLPNAIAGMREMEKKGYKLVVITNQSGIGRGYYTEKDYTELMNYMFSVLKNSGISFLGEYHCSHSPESGCSCRKPNANLILKAAEEHKIDLSRSYMVGDKTADILAGRNAKVTTILVKTGKAGKDNAYDATPDYIAKDLLDAALMIKDIKHENSHFA